MFKSTLKSNNLKFIVKVCEVICYSYVIFSNDKHFTCELNTLLLNVRVTEILRGFLLK